MIDHDAPFAPFGERIAGVTKRGQQRVFGCDDRLGARRITRLERQRRRGRVDRKDKRLAARVANFDRDNAIERAGIRHDRYIDRVASGVDFVRELRVPVAEAVRGVLQ